MDAGYFDQEAGAWDLKAMRVILAQGVARAIQDRVPLSKAMDVLDFGCGTGLVTLALGPLVGTITGADTSPGMLKVLSEKAGAAGVPVTLRALDGGAGLALGGPYHLIVSSMTLHHVADVPGLFHQFAAHLLPGGQVALADLDAEDGSFHDGIPGVEHHGFRREQVRAWLESAGFREIRLETAIVTRKGEKDYPVFLATGKRVQEDIGTIP
ncbi:MAG: class I SAM-dependent methyltransferase [Holophaga sp.]|nr:class I SAM-dependent methyltransferase [Holophaga sp.]